MDYIVQFTDKLESLLPMSGPLAIPARFVVGAGLGWLVLSAIQPSFAYTPDGGKRPWVAMPDLYEGRGAPTWLPWFVGPLLGGFVLTTFV